MIGSKHDSDESSFTICFDGEFHCVYRRLWAVNLRLFMARQMTSMQKRTLKVAGVEEDNAERQGARDAQNGDEAGIQRPHAETDGDGDRCLPKQDHSAAKLSLQSSETKTTQR
jgi:hypothetical protein